MAAAPSRAHRKLSAGHLWKYGITALVLVVAGYLIHFYSIPPCLHSKSQEHVSPNGTYTVTEYSSCFSNRISITNNQRGKVTDDLAAINRNTYLLDRWFFCPSTTRFLGWKS